jgi:uncharacterized protein YcfJ
MDLHELRLLSEGAVSQANEIKQGALAKSAKEHMEAASVYANNNNPTKAKRELDAAIKDLRSVKNECQKIDDDVTVVHFLQTLINTIAGTVIGFFAGATLGMLVGFICGSGKEINFRSAVAKNLTTPNKNGGNNTIFKVGATRGETLMHFDRMISVCEEAKEQL